MCICTCVSPPNAAVCNSLSLHDLVLLHSTCIQTRLISLCAGIWFKLFCPF